MTQNTAHPLNWQPIDAALAALALARALGCGDDTSLIHHIAARHPQAEDKLALMLSLINDMASGADGFETVLALIGATCEGDNKDKAEAVYALCADYIAAHGTATPEEMRLLEKLGEALTIDRLRRAALDMAAQTRGVKLS